MQFFNFNVINNPNSKLFQKRKASFWQKDCFEAFIGRLKEAGIDLEKNQLENKNNLMLLRLYDQLENNHPLKKCIKYDKKFYFTLVPEEKGEIIFNRLKHLKLHLFGGEKANTGGPENTLPHPLLFFPLNIFDQYPLEKIDNLAIDFFDQLPLSSISNLAAVSRKNNQNIKQYLTHRKLSFVIPEGQPIIKTLKTCQLEGQVNDVLKHLDLSLVHNISEDDLKYISANFPNLSSLEVNCTNITYKEMNFISKKMPKIQTANQKYCYLIPKAQNIIQALKACQMEGQVNTSFKHLDLSGRMDITQQDIEFISANFPNLRSLDLNGTEMNGDLLNFISQKMLQIEYLNLGLNFKIRVEGLSSLQNFKFLKFLNLSHTNIEDNDFQVLEGLTNLIFLDLLHSSNIQANGLRSLKKLPNLKHLSLSYCNSIGEVEDFQQLEGFPALESLDLSWVFNDPASVGPEHFRDTYTLKSLNLSRYPITDDDLERFQELTNLTSLDLNGCDEITDKGLKFLRELKKLTFLDVRDCDKITEKGIRGFKEDPSKRDLTLLELTTYGL